MAFQPAPNVAKVTLTFKQGEQVAQNIMHVHTGNSWTTEHLENLCALFYAWWSTTLRPYVSTGVTLESIVARDLTEEFDDEVTHAGTFPLAGTLASPVLPFNSTPVISWRSGLTGRSTRGRTYHVGISEAQVAGGTLDSVAQAALQGAYEDLMEQISADSEPWQLGVLSRVQNGTPLTEAILYAFLSVIVDDAMDSQRRRLPGRGI